MVICSICSHSDWCDGGDQCDCQCHDSYYFEGELEDGADDEDEAIEDYEED